MFVGASSGIGAATAKHFAECGVKLVLAGRNEENLNKVAEDCMTLSGLQVLSPIMLDWWFKLTGVPWLVCLNW